MKNADMPAMPQSSTSDGYPCNYTDYAGVGIPTGLTKREMIAMHVISGLSSHPDMMRSNDDGLRDTIAQTIAAQSVMLADCLLSELERTK